MTNMDTIQSYVNILDALEAIRLSADWSGVDIWSEQEVVDSGLIGKSTKLSGREVLHIAVPYERSRDFLVKQAEILKRELVKLDEAKLVAEQELSKVNDEMNS